MQSLPKHLHEMFKRDRAQLPEDGELTGYITYTDVLAGYYFLIDYFSQNPASGGMLAGLRDPGLLSSALARQVVSFGSVRKWTEPLDIAATLYFGLVKNHAFHDGNKRIALLMLLCTLRRNKRWITCRQLELESLTVATAASLLYSRFPGEAKRFRDKADGEILLLSRFLRNNTRNISEQHRSITYRDLKRTLNQHGFDIDNPDNNHISVYRRTEVRSLWGFGETKIKTVRIGGIGFPSWTKQVSYADLRQVRSMTGLTTENGFDNAVFYDGNEPMFQLIDEFEGPLRRLKDR